MQGRAESIHRSRHGLKDAMINVKPSLFGFKGWRPGSDFHFIPVISHRLHNHTGVTPVNQVGRIGNPDGPGRNLRMGPVQTYIPAAELFRENDYVAKIGLGDQGHPFHFFKIPGTRQGNPHAVTGIGAVGQQVLSLHRANSEVLDPERLIFPKNAVG